MSLSLSDASAPCWGPFVIGGIHYSCPVLPPPQMGSVITTDPLWQPQHLHYVTAATLSLQQLSNCLGDTPGWDSNLSSGGLAVCEPVNVCMWVCAHVVLFVSVCVCVCVCVCVQVLCFCLCVPFFFKLLFLNESVCSSNHEWLCAVYFPVTNRLFGWIILIYSPVWFPWQHFSIPAFAQTLPTIPGTYTDP